MFKQGDRVVLVADYPGVNNGDIGTVVESGELVSKVVFESHRITQKVMTAHLVSTTPVTFSIGLWLTSMAAAFGWPYALDLAPEYLKYDGMTADQIPMRLPAEWFR